MRTTTGIMRTMMVVAMVLRLGVNAVCAQALTAITPGEVWPDEFTRQMAQDMRIAQGRKPSPRDMLAQWVHRGYIAYDEARGVYVRTGK